MVNIQSLAIQLLFGLNIHLTQTKRPFKRDERSTTMQYLNDHVSSKLFEFVVFNNISQFVPIILSYHACSIVSADMMLLIACLESEGEKATITRRASLMPCTLLSRITAKIMMQRQLLVTDPRQRWVSRRRLQSDLVQ